MMTADRRAKLWGTLRDLVFPIVSLVVAAGLVVLIVTSILRALDAVQSQIATAIVAGSVTIALSVLGVVITKSYERRAALERDSRTKRIPVYEDFVGFVFRLFQQGKPHTKKMTEAEMVKVLLECTQKLAVWSSDEVLREFGRFRTLAVQQEKAVNPPDTVMFALEDLMFAIRRDLGYKNAGLRRGDLLRLFINDIDEHLPERSSSSTPDHRHSISEPEASPAQARLRSDFGVINPEAEVLGSKQRDPVSRDGQKRRV